MPFIPNTEEELNAMLKEIGVDSFEELLCNIPKNIRLEGPLDLPKPLSEFEVTKLIAEKAAQNKNTTDNVCFLGGGAYDHYIPAAVDHIISRSEFYTAYTPYQPEVSQGTLQVIYEYQSMICELTQMEVSNASMYDGASALAEAALVAYNSTRRTELVISKSINPNYLEVIKTYCHGQNIKIHVIDLHNGVTNLEKLKEAVSENTAAVILQHPNFFGCLEDVVKAGQLAHEKGALFITSNDPVSLGILEPPGAYDADIATGEGQALGNTLSFGGPYIGLFTSKKELMRKVPGRIAGQTVDSKGRRGFVLTYQTREQHIRRDKATSNICTNQALCALAATVYMALMGKYGIKTVASLSAQKSHYLAEKIKQLPGYEIAFSQPFFKEFTVRTPVKPDEIINKLAEKGIFSGIALNEFDVGCDDCMLIAVTEKRTIEEMDAFVAALGEFK